MFFAGIAWSTAGFDVDVRDSAGQPAAPSRHFGTTGSLVDHLVRLPAQGADPLVCVIDSTNGMVDGHLLSRGIRVVRADPWNLPPRTTFGSVGAETLARTAADRLADLTPLALTEGTLTARSADHARAADDSAATLTTMTEQGGCLAHGRADAEDPVVALTFDDGPNPPYTDRILDVLDRYEVPATFFCVGLHAHAHAEHLARMTESGHRVANHTWSHPFLPDLAWPEVRAQLDRTDDAIGREPRNERRLFRPPYGSGTPEVFSRLGADPATTTVLWDVDTADWSMPGPEAIRTTVLQRVRPGSIVLMHDGGGDRAHTVNALPAVIEGLLSRGFRFARVDTVGFAGG